MTFPFCWTGPVGRVFGWGLALRGLFCPHRRFGGVVTQFALWRPVGVEDLPGPPLSQGWSPLSPETLIIPGPGPLVLEWSGKRSVYPLLHSFPLYRPGPCGLFSSTALLLQGVDVTLYGVSPSTDSPVFFSSSYVKIDSLLFLMISDG